MYYIQQIYCIEHYIS